MVERALKERHLKGQSVRAVIFVDIGGMRSEGPTPKVFRCRTYSAPITALTDCPIRCRAFSPRSLEFVEHTLIANLLPRERFAYAN